MPLKFTDAMVGRSCDHDDDIIVGLDLHIGEKARAVQAANRLGGFFIGEFLAHFHGEITEYGAGVGSLDPFYADIPHDERVEGVSHGRNEQRGDKTRQYTPSCVETSGEKTSLSILGRANGGDFICY